MHLIIYISPFCNSRNFTFGIDFVTDATVSDMNISAQAADRVFNNVPPAAVVRRLSPAAMGTAVALKYEIVQGSQWF